MTTYYDTIDEGLAGMEREKFGQFEEGYFLGEGEDQVEIVTGYVIFCIDDISQEDLDAGSFDLEDAWLFSCDRFGEEITGFNSDLTDSMDDFDEEEWEDYLMRVRPINVNYENSNYWHHQG